MESVGVEARWGGGGGHRTHTYLREMFLDYALISGSWRLTLLEKTIRAEGMGWDLKGWGGA